ncbi:MAG: hypothetical protein ACHQEM_13110, partial [Chitinophagales bacterium]
HLQFFGAQRIPGTSPKGPAGSSMQISFKDTLILMDQLAIPVKFLHKDTTKNLKGVFIQVVGLKGGPVVASDYFDVPEVAQIDTTSDTVSVIMIGIDPAGLELPFDFNITITPHGANGDPITQITRAVRVVPHHEGPTNGPGGCSIANPGVKVWDWDGSYIVSKKPGVQFDFYDDPNRVFGTNGQLVGGSCCAGISIPGICPGERKPNRTLHFDTYYQIFKEQFIFFAQNTYFRVTGEDAPIPLPDKSDFCSGVAGAIQANNNITSYNGTYEIVPATLPADLQNLHDSLAVQLMQTSAINGGFGNGAGIIHQLDCTYGNLVLIQVDLEGFGQHLYRFYTLRDPHQLKWFDM